MSSLEIVALTLFASLLSFLFALIIFYRLGGPEGMSSLSDCMVKMIDALARLVDSIGRAFKSQTERGPVLPSNITAVDVRISDAHRRDELPESQISAGAEVDLVHLSADEPSHEVNDAD